MVLCLSLLFSFDLTLILPLIWSHSIHSIFFAFCLPSPYIALKTENANTVTKELQGPLNSQLLFFFCTHFFSTTSIKARRLNLYGQPFWKIIEEEQQKDSEEFKKKKVKPPLSADTAQLAQTGGAQTSLGVCEHSF